MNDNHPHVYENLYNIFSLDNICEITSISAGENHTDIHLSGDVEDPAYYLEFTLGPNECIEGLPFWLFDPLQVLNHAIDAGSSFVMEFKENELESISLNVERLLVVGGLK
jgi:hypothetical protein